MLRKLLITVPIAIAAMALGRKYRNKETPTEDWELDGLPPQFTFQGHRGARGLLPENTIPSFLKCLALGVNAIELDVVISADKQVVVSHEEWFSHKICSLPNGDAISKKEEKNYLIYQMPYEQVKAFDCGDIGHPDFPQQQPMPAHKPLLKDVIAACDRFARENNLPQVTYNIEVKTTGEKGDNTYHPEPDEFAELVYNVVQQMNIKERSILQSFDRRIVQQLHAIDNTLTLSLLVDNMYSMEWNIKKLGFTPDVYAPYYKFITKKLVEKVHAKNMKLITWTVNDIHTMRKLIMWGVDSIITDYPNLKVAFEDEEE